MLTERWMPWAVTGGLLVSASLVCGAAWFASATDHAAAPVEKSPPPAVSGPCGCRIDSVQVRHPSGTVLKRRAEFDSDAGTAVSQCVLLVHSECPVGRARVSVIASPDSCGRLVATERCEFRSGHNVVSLACHATAEPAAVVIETPTGTVMAPISLSPIEDRRTAGN